MIRNKNKKSAFTIIELIIVISIAGIFSISFLKGYSLLQETLTKNKIDLKMAQIEKSLIQSFNDNINSYIYKNEIYDKNGNTIYSGVSNGTIRQMRMKTNTLNSNLSDRKDEETAILSFFNLSKRTIHDIGANNIDIIINTNIIKDEVSYPVKEISIISWGKLNKMKGFTKLVKGDLVKTDTDSTTGHSKTYIKKITSTNLTPRLSAFLTSNDSYYQIFRKEIKMVTVSNANIMKNKIEETLGKFNKISNYLNEWIDEKIKSNKLRGGSPGVDYLAFMPVDLTKEYLNIPQSKDYGGSGDLNGNYISNIDENYLTSPKNIEEFSNEIVFIDSSITASTLSAGDFKLTKIEDKGIKLTGLGLTPTVEFKFKGFVPLELYNENGTDFDGNNNFDPSGDFNVKILENSKKIMGINSSFDAVESFLGIPFMVSNTSKGEIKIEGITNPNGDMTFYNNLPILNTVGTSTETNYPPYSMHLLCVFPWFSDIKASTDIINPNMSIKENYGFISKQIYSVSKGF